MLTAVVCSGTNRPQSSMPQWESMARALYRPGERRVVGSRLAGPAVMAGYRAGCGGGLRGCGGGLRRRAYAVQLCPGAFLHGSTEW